MISWVLRGAIYHLRYTVIFWCSLFSFPRVVPDPDHPVSPGQISAAVEEHVPVLTNITNRLDSVEEKIAALETKVRSYAAAAAPLMHFHHHPKCLETLQTPHGTLRIRYYSKHETSSPQFKTPWWT